MLLSSGTNFQSFHGTTGPSRANAACTERLDLQAVNEGAFMAAAVDGGKHRIEIKDCMDVQYAPWTAKLG